MVIAISGCIKQTIKRDYVCPDGSIVSDPSLCPVTTTITTTTTSIPTTTTTVISSLEMKCIDSGGTVSTSMCCKNIVEFPNTCLVGACGCSLENSHEVKVCDCPEGKCFDGNTCILNCEDYHFSNCLEGCVRECVPSVCSGNICTTDCEGPGSCLNP